MCELNLNTDYCMCLAAHSALIKLSSVGQNMLLFIPIPTQKHWSNIHPSCMYIPNGQNPHWLGYSLLLDATQCIQHGAYAHEDQLATLTDGWSVLHQVYTTAWPGTITACHTSSWLLLCYHWILNLLFTNTKPVIMFMVWQAHRHYVRTSQAKETKTIMCLKHYAM
jgi:hypothetical protein